MDLRPDLKRRDSNKPDQEPSKDNLKGQVKVPEGLAKEAAKKSGGSGAGGDSKKVGKK